MSTLVLPFPAINPILFQWGPLAIRWYALAYIAGLIAGWALIRRVVADDRLWGGAPRPSPDSIDDLLVYCAIGVIVGGRLGNVLFYDPRYYFSHPIEIFKVWEGGMAFHGGLIGAAAGRRAVRAPLPDAALKRVRSRLARRADRRLPRPAGQFHQAGAVGPADRRPLGDRLSRLGRTAAPSQPDLRSAARRAGDLRRPIFAARAGALRRPGLIAGAFGALYGAARIFCEFYRDPDPRLEDLGHGLTMGMVLSAPLIVIGLGLVAWSLRRVGEETT